MGRVLAQQPSSLDSRRRDLRRIALRAPPLGIASRRVRRGGEKILLIADAVSQELAGVFKLAAVGQMGVLVQPAFAVRNPVGKVLRLLPGHLGDQVVADPQVGARRSRPGCTRRCNP